MQVTSLYICPWSLEDPLCQSQSLPYLRGLVAAEGYKFALITFENPIFALTGEQLEERKKQLEEEGIYWYPTSYHQGMSIFAKAYDNFTGLLLGLKICWRHKPQIIHSRSSLPTVVALSLAKLYRLKFLYDADSLLSEEYADNDHWSRKSLGYTMMTKAEALARRSATRIIVLSNLLKHDFQHTYKVKTLIDVIPCCVETTKFRPNLHIREQRRKELGLEDEKLLIYVGKSGGRYLVEEIFDFFKVAQNLVKSFRLLIVSQENPETFNEIARAKNIDSNCYFIKSASHEEVSEYLSAADIGIAFMRNVNSERGSSPIKVAEYLATGLPVIITEGVGDCSSLVKQKNIGTVIQETNEENYLIAINHLLKLWEEDASQISARCQQEAEESFSLKKVGVVRYSQIYQKLLYF